MSSTILVSCVVVLTVLSSSWTVAIPTNVLDGRVEPLTKSEAEALTDQIAAECRLPNFYSGDIVDIKTKNGEDYFQNYKCSVACILKRIGIVNPNNQLDLEGLKKVDEVFPDDFYEETLADTPCIPEKVYKKCSQIKQKDECEFGWAISECLTEVCELNLLR